MQLKQSPILAIQPSANTPPAFTANILPVRAQASYPVNASSRYWNPEPLARCTGASANETLRDGECRREEAEDVEEGKEGGKESKETVKCGDRNEGVKVSYFRGRKLLGREVGLWDMGYKGD